MKSDERGIANIVLKYGITIFVTILIVFAINQININEIYKEYLKDEVAISTLGNSIGVNENLDEMESSQCITSVGAKIADSLNIEINGFKIQVADSVFGYVNSSEDRNEILEKVCLSYINELGIDSENVVKVYVNDNLEAIPEKVDISKIETTGEIAKELYDAVVINENLLNMQLEVINNSIESIETSVIEEKCDELYMGETSIEEGENGEKLVYTKSYYNGIDKVSESVIDEVIIKEAKPAIVKKGVKNPYYDGVKFLGHPLKDAWISSVFGEDRGNSYHKIGRAHV